jgi:hypothetical protein
MKDGNQLVWVLVLLFLVFSGNLGSFIGPAPPFATDQPSALVVEETEQRTTQLTTLFAALQGQVPAGRYRQLDKDNPPLQDEKWVQDAWAVWEKDGKQVPWVVAASKHGGVHQAVPTDLTKASTLLQGLGK